MEAPPDVVGSEVGNSILVASIVHEISHLLGAKHAQAGIMKRNLNSKHMSQLSASSVTEISQFIEEDARSWCVSRNILTEGAEKKTTWSYLREFYLFHGARTFLAFGTRKVNAANSEKGPNYVIFAVYDPSRFSGGGREFEIRKFVLSSNGKLVLQEWNSVPVEMSNRTSTKNFMVFPPPPAGSFQPSEDSSNRYVTMELADQFPWQEFNQKTIMTLFFSKWTPK